MARLAIILIAVFWATVTVASLVWEMTDPASISSDQRAEALPPGLSGGVGAPATGPTLAELTPELRASLREQVADDHTAVAKPHADGGHDASASPTDTIGGPVASPSRVDASLSSTPLPRPRPRPDQLANVAPPAATERPIRPTPTDGGGDSRVAEAQTRLLALGYRLGAADGQMGPQTRTAIKAYEKKAGLKVDGEVDDRLLARLRSESRLTRREDAAARNAADAAPQRSLTGRVLGKVQQLIGQDFDSVSAPQRLAAYCTERGDEWIYDRGRDRMRSCAEVVGNPKVAFRPLPGDR